MFHSLGDLETFFNSLKKHFADNCTIQSITFIKKSLGKVIKQAKEISWVQETPDYDKQKPSLNPTIWA